MRHIYTFTLLLLFYTSLNAQYKYFSSDGNLYNQSVLETSDDGYLLGSYRDCYTPGSITIEGCINALHLIKTDGEGDTLWTNLVPFTTQYGSRVNIFEEEDGTYTIIVTKNSSYLCGYIGIGLSGWRQVEVIKVDALGKLLNKTELLEECQFTMRDVMKLTNDRYLLLAFYDEPFNDDANEGRLLVIDGMGNILNETVFPYIEFRAGRLLQTDMNTVVVSYVEDGNMVFKRFDHDLNELAEVVNSEMEYNCTTRHSHASVLEDGNLVRFCYDRLADVENSNFYVFDASFELLHHAVLDLIEPTNFIEVGNNLLANASLNEESDTVTNAQINYFDTSGEYLYSTTIYGTENEEPSELQSIEEDRLILVGRANCCNMDSIYGPGKTFLTIEENPTTSSSEIGTKEGIRIGPNPSNGKVVVELNEEGIIHAYTELYLFSEQGRLMMKSLLNPGENELNLEGMEPGVYFYRILSEDQDLAHGKLIKVRGF